MWGAPRQPPRNLSGSAARELSLSIARAMAPDLGVTPDDLVVSGTTELEGFTVVMVRQSHRGVPVERGFLSFTFREGQLALIRNELLVPRLPVSAPALFPQEAEQLALEAVHQITTEAALTRQAQLVLWAPGDRPEALRLAWKVHTSAEAPRRELDFFIDARTGLILAADDQVRYADGEGRVRIEVDPVQPQTGTVPFTASFVELGLESTDSDGETLQNGNVSLRYEGPYVRVSDQSGAPIESFQLDFSGPYRTYDYTPQSFSQADPFVHLNEVKRFARQLTPNLGWIDRQLTVNVNINDNCNAFWDGQTVNFFRSGGGCNNTGRISSIVYHEFGHGYHQFLTNNIVGSVGEGTGDFLAATFLGDPIVGRGFATNGAGIRRIDQDYRFPDDYTGEVHQDGLIWASALWDLREAMMAKHGAWAGRIITDRLFVQALAQGPGLSTSYPLIVAADDDDNDPENGSPNSCEINAIWDAHGMLSSGQIQHTRAGERAYVAIRHDAPGRFSVGADGTVSVTASAENISDCSSFDVNALTLFHALGAEGEDWQQVPMIPETEGSKGSIPGLQPGQPFRYYFELTTAEQTFRNGSAERPHFGVVDRGQIAVFSEDFEAGLGEWTHGTVGSDLVDDWEVASPDGRYFDPFEARSGERVAGTDLGREGGPGGTDGAAKPGRHTFFESGPITTSGVKELELELWHHFAIDGTLRVLADGQEVWTRTIDNDWSGGWRHLSIPLPETTADRTDPFTVRFEVETSATNQLGGWSIDDVAVTGVEIPPPPTRPEEDPPPKDPPQDDPPPQDPPNVSMDPTDPTDPAGEATDDPSVAPQGVDGSNGLSYRSIGGGCVCAQSPRQTGTLAVLLLGGLLILRRRH